MSALAPLPDPMAPYLDRFWQGDALDYARLLPTGSVDLVVTSPAYWKLRNYLHPGQWGQERTPEEYVARLVELFREVQRVLKPRGSVLLNLGDTYYNNPGGSSATMTTGNQAAVAAVGRQRRALPHPTIRTKELVGIPWMAAFALRADGWRIRSENIWHKPNGLPETVTDRTTRNHEHVFHLTLHPKAYWDWRAIAEPAKWERWGKQTVKKGPGTEMKSGHVREESKAAILARFQHRPKNRRSVWTIPVRSYGGAHKAVMPVALAALGVAAGSPPGGVVWDPFMGAGTTAIVAMALGRHFLGSELFPDSVEEASRRLNREAERLLAFGQARLARARRAAVAARPMPLFPELEAAG